MKKSHDLPANEFTQRVVKVKSFIISTGPSEKGPSFHIIITHNHNKFRSFKTLR